MVGVSAGGSGWLCQNSDSIVLCTRSTVALGAAPDITITVEAPGTAGTNISNTVIISAATFEPAPGNNVSTEVTAIFPPEIFADGFESGNTSAWSTTVPPQP